MSILIFLGVLVVLVLVHELGHFAVAKWTGMRVDEFGIGFPPKLFGIKKGETLYSINLLPLGGFVKIQGEDAVGNDGHIAVDERSFTAKSKKAQSAVLLAGITMNILFAWFLFAVAFWVGVESAVTETDASPEARLTITSVLPGSPAEKAQIPPGSIIQTVTAGNESLSELKPSAFSAFVSVHGDKPVAIAYTYKDELRLASVVPEKGVLSDSADKRAIGVSLTQIDTVHRTFVESITDSFFYTLAGLRDITVGIFKLIYDAVMIKADLSQVAGPVGIVGLVGEASAYGVTALLMFTAFISLNLAVINVLPFPALDGGRFVMVLIEAVKGSPITPKYAATANAVGFFILIALMIVVTWNDIAKLL